MRGFFYGNWAYGLFAVALGMEAALQQRIPINGWLYQVISYLGVVVFYNRAYSGLVAQRSETDDRVRWYALHGQGQGLVQKGLIVLLVLCLCFAIHGSWQRLLDMGAIQAGLFALFPLMGLAYYGNGRVGLRMVGWVKPFALGFVWAGVVTVYPLLVYMVLTGSVAPDVGISARLFFKNMMFVAVLGVLFDIKDHAEDHRSDLRTFVVQRGLRITLFRIVLPLTLIGLFSFLGYGWLNGFSSMKLLFNTIPFVALLAVVYALRKRRSMLYYLVVVDGLMLVKAVCGSLAMFWF